MRAIARLPVMIGDLQPHHPGQAPGVLNVPQRAALRFRWGERSEVNADVQVTPAGLLSIGGLVSMILLGSAVIVRAAGQARARASGKTDTG